MRSWCTPEWFQIPDVVFTTPREHWPRNSSSKFFLVEIGRLKEFLSKASELGSYRSDDSRTAILCNSDRRLSEINPHVREGLSALFSRIFIPGYDERVPKFDVYPVGLTEHYLRGNFGLLRKLRKSARSQDRTIPVLAEWGAVWPGLEDTITDRAQASNWARVNSKFVHFGKSPLKDHLTNLSVARYSLCPSGHGIQSPKVFESWYLGAVPIVQRNQTFQRLSELGFPLLIVDSWSEITEEYLSAKYEEMKSLVDDFLPHTEDARSFFERCFGVNQRASGAH